MYILVYLSALIAGLSCADSSLPPPPDETTTGEVLDSGSGGACAGSAPRFDLRSLEASPMIPSVPVGIVDAIQVPQAITGICLRQNFSAGGTVTACADASADSSLYFQGLPAPDQSITLELGVIWEGQTDPCWSGEIHDLTLGSVTAVPLDFEVTGEALSGLDYPPLTLSTLITGDLQLIYGMALLDAPAFGIAAGDVLWSRDISDQERYVVELQSLDNGLLLYSLENDDDSGNHAPFDPNYDGVPTLGIDRAGYEWIRDEGCGDTDDAPCLGYLHHGNAAISSLNSAVVNSYEQLLDASGAPLIVDVEGRATPLISTTFQILSIDPQQETAPSPRLSFHNLMGQDPADVEVLPLSALVGPDSSPYVPLYYVNSTELRPDNLSPERLHLTGTLQTHPWVGAFDIELSAAGEVERATLYSTSNPALTWPADFEGFRAVHSAEFTWRESDTGAIELVIYDQAIIDSSGPYSGCSGFFHLRVLDGVVEVGGPFQAVFELPGEGPICGNSQAFGDAAFLSDVQVDGYPDPVGLVVVSDNLATAPTELSDNGVVSDVYYDGAPRVTGVFLNTDPQDIKGWESAFGFFGRNPTAVSPPGFSNVVRWAPALMVSDSTLGDFSRRL